ncbi:MAG: hypothetical protein GY761_13175 [Hyphomicrobiales bacterium]|nr:hypothetical protein [Hyphomicrobiales bacterium]
MTKKTFKKDVSDSEVARFMSDSSIFGSLMSEVVLRVEPEDHSEKTPSEKPASSKPTAQPNTHKTKPQQIHLSDDQYAYLQSIANNPNRSVTQLKNDIGFSTDKANTVKKSLIDVGMIEAFTVNLGVTAGGLIKLLEITNAGYQVLGIKPTLTRLGRVSAEHWFWQIQMHRYFCSLEYEAEIEKCLDGKFADVGLLKDERWIAYEIAISPSNEVRNVQEDLAVGFSSVVVACKNVAIRKSVEQQLQSHLTEEQHSKTQVMLCSEFSFVKELFGSNKTVQHASLQSSNTEIVL